MPNHQLLDNVTHKDVRVVTAHHPKYGDQGSYTNVFLSEFRQVQAHYPILFRKHTETGQFEAIALFGFAEQENLYLDNNGWNAHYVPLSIQRRPFLIGFQENHEQGVASADPVVHIDMSSPRVNNSEGESVFLAQGGQSPYLQHISSVLNAIHIGHQQTREFIDILLGHELIEAVKIKVTLNNGSQNELASVYTVNEDKLNDLSQEALYDLQQQGYLAFIYMIIASQSQLTTLIEYKNARL